MIKVAIAIVAGIIVILVIGYVAAFMLFALVDGIKRKR